MLVAELWNANRGGHALPGSVTLHLTDTLRARVQAAAKGLGEFGPGSVTLDGEDVGLLVCAPQDITRRIGTTAVDKSGAGLAVTIHGGQLDDEPGVMPRQGAVVALAKGEVMTAYTDVVLLSMDAFIAELLAESSRRVTRAGLPSRTRR